MSALSLLQAGAYGLSTLQDAWPGLSQPQRRAVAEQLGHLVGRLHAAAIKLAAAAPVAGKPSSSGIAPASNQQHNQQQLQQQPDGTCK